MLRLLMLVMMTTLPFPGGVFASWSAIGSDHKELKGYTIAAVGELAKNTRYDYSMAERQEWYTFEEAFGPPACLAFLGTEPYSLDYEAALLLVDERGNLKLAIIESSVGSIKVAVETIEVVRCPQE